MKPTTILFVTCLAVSAAAATRVQAQIYCPDDPDDYVVVWGGETSGDALELCISDDEYLEVKQAPQFTPLFPHIDLRYWLHVDAQTANSIIYSIEGRVTALVSGGQHSQTLRTYIRNYARAWDLIDVRGTDPHNDEQISHIQSENAGNYIRQGDGEVLVRHQVWPPGEVLSPNWGLKIDQFTVTVIE